MTPTAGPGRLVQVVVTLPVGGPFTYRIPEGVPDLEFGTQVVVPFSGRLTTGFVVGSAPPGEITGGRSRRAPTIRDLHDVLDPEPVLDQNVFELCLFAARYYGARLGEVLRTAMPQGERAAARRVVRLSEEGRRLLDLEKAGRGDIRLLALDGVDRALCARLRAGKFLGLRGVQADPALGVVRLQRLEREGLLEIGDEVRERRSDAVDRFAVVTDAGHVNVAEVLGRAAAQKALFARLAAAPGGARAVTELTPPERAALRGLVQRGLAKVDERPRTFAQVTSAEPGSPLELNQHQEVARDKLVAALDQGFAAFLLQGITGSGKTEVYLRLIAEARARGRGALVLVPEIALTPQLAARFRARFGDDVAVLHSGLPAAERLRAWRDLSRGKVNIALGARSAVFAPVRDLAVVVIDEEHDGSFKQDEGVCYNGRDLALVRARNAGAVAVLGSATPSLESTHNVITGKFVKLELPNRAAPGASGRPLPEVQMVDLRRLPPDADGLFAAFTLEAIRATLAAGEQAILFLNRRGFATVVLCRTCGHVVRCDDCAVAMTWHRARGHLVCHYCGRTRSMPSRCGKCANATVEPLGTGTERVETIVREKFPGARVARLDRDTVNERARAVGPDGRPAPGGAARALEQILGQVAAREVDILIGTQMVAKGHDFPGVTLVCVLQPDQALNLPDFRATERTFQLLEQVAGRAGRAEKAGRVVVQTYNPNHPAMQALLTHDYAGFAREELRARQEAGYPPFARMAVIRLEGPIEDDVRRIAGEVATAARQGAEPGVKVLGPAEAPLARLRGRYRFQIWLAGANRASLHGPMHSAAQVRPGKVRVAVDVDPQSVL